MITTYEANKLLAYMKASNDVKYLALNTTMPTIDSPGTEVVGGGYARQIVPFADPVNREMQTSAMMQFPVATTSWGTIVGFSLWDSLTGGNQTWFGTLTDTANNLITKQITAGDTFQVPAADLLINLK